MLTREKIEELEEQTLAPYAMKSKDSAGREHPEQQHGTRTCYQRDRDRVVHSEAFRKLEYKTQVFAVLEGDYYRTRLTHTLEVSQIARTIGRNLMLNEDLIEAIALAHDIGHPPFGHAGEKILNEILIDKGLKGFNHNKHSFDIVTKLEKRYPQFDGLNLTREVLVGILKHRTQYDIPHDHKDFLEEWPTLEAQVVDIADSLAYLNHDIDDGITSGCITPEDLLESSLWRKVWKNLNKEYKSDNKEILKYQIVKSLIDMQVGDLLEASDERLEKATIPSADEAKKGRNTFIDFSEQMREERNRLQGLLNTKLYHHYRVARMTSKAKRLISEIFEVYEKNMEQLPYSVFPRGKEYSDAEKHEIICNYIASMTDRFVLEEHKKLFNPYEKV